MKYTIFELLNENAKMPVRGSEQAGGWDITATEIIQEAPDFVRVLTGLKIQPPENHKVWITPRSNLTKHHWVVQNSPCLGDEDFVGEYEIRFRAFPTGAHLTRSDIEYANSFEATNLEFNYPDFPYKVGERVAQMCLSKVIDMKLSKGKVRQTKRGAGGFGSTGL
jgi:dUTPase